MLLYPCPYSVPLRDYLYLISEKLLTNTSKRKMAPTMCAPGAKYIAADLHITSAVVSTLTVALYLLGLAIGPMFMSPLSEMFGRVPVCHGATTIFVAFIIGTALSKTTAQFMVFRFISGCAGGTPGIRWWDHRRYYQRAATGGRHGIVQYGSTCGASKSYLFSEIEKDRILTSFNQVLGPVIGGFVAAGKGWRWTFWLLAILGGFFGAIAVPLLRETHPKVLLERKAAHLRVAAGNPRWRSK